MTTETLHRSIMPWDGFPSSERLLNGLIAVGLILVILLYFIIPRIELPVEEVEEIPERFAQLIIEEEPEVIPPPPIPEEEPVEEVVEEEPEVIEEEEPEPEPEVVEKPEQTVEEAREIAEQSGLMAFQDSLAAMRDSLTLQNTSAPLISANNTQRKEYKGSDLNTDLTSGSGGVDTAKYTQNTGVTGNLGGRSGSSVSGGKIKASGSGVGKAKSTRGTTKSARSSEQIDLALNSLKGTLDRLYNKARRSDPTLEGFVQFEAKVDASGKVVEIKVTRSLLSAPELEQKMLDRIKLMGNFGPGIVETITFQIEFTP